MKRFFLEAFVLFIISVAAAGCGVGRSLDLTPPPLRTNTPIPTYTPLFTSIPTLTSTLSQKPTPTPAPPAFLGKIIVMEENDLFELSTSKNQPQGASNLIAGNVIEAAISPDFSHIVYNTYTPDRSGSATHLYDLNAHTDAVILPYMADDFAWSPDGQRFSYTVLDEPKVPEGLYLYDLGSSTSRLVYAPPCAAYALLNNRQRVCGAMHGMSWVTPDVLVFQRFSGVMPQEIGSLQSEVPADTTSLVHFTNGSQSLVDSPRRWLIQDSCGEKVLLRDDTSEGTTDFFIADTAEFIVKPGSLDPIPIKRCAKESPDCASIPGNWILSTAYRPYIGFFPNSCSAFYFSGDYQKPVLHSLSPDALETRTSPLPWHLGMIAFRSDFAWTADWPDRPDAQIALLPYYSNADIDIVDLQTSMSVTIWEGGNTEDCRLLAWIAP